MAQKPLPPVNPNFDPTFIKPFFYWTQSVLPLVYDDSLSYQELWGQVVLKLNELINTFNSESEALSTALSEYYNAVSVLIANYQEDLSSQLNNNALLYNQLYNQSLDLYNKTLQQNQILQDYVDTAISNLGSIAVWSISDDGFLLATVFNSGVILAVGMTPDGRMEITVNE